MTIQKRILLFFSLIVALLGISFFLMSYRIRLQRELIQAQEQRYDSFRLAAILKNGTEELGRMARTYTLTGDPAYREAYQHILEIEEGRAPRPDRDPLLYRDFFTDSDENLSTGRIVSLAALLQGASLRSHERALLLQAQELLKKLNAMERQAFRLMDLAAIQDELSDANRLAAQELLFSRRYRRLRGRLMHLVSQFSRSVDRRTQEHITRIRTQGTRIDQSLGALLLLTILFALFSWRHTRRTIVEPLQRLIAWTDALGRGDYRIPPRPSGRDEIAHLSRSFVSMAQTIRQQMETLELMAHTDRLTGLPNRRHLEREMKHLLERSRQSGQPLNLVLLDLDHFKKINDRYGHEMGDRVLIHFARLLRDAASDPRYLGRWGGEEFVMLFPELAPHICVQEMETLRRQVAETRFDQEITLTVSIGIATATPRDADIHEILERADRALYRAKDAGRNRVVRDGADS